MPFDEGLRATVEWYRDERMVVAADQGTGPRLPRVLPDTVRKSLTPDHPWRLAHHERSGDRHRRRRVRGQPSAHRAHSNGIPTVGWWNPTGRSPSDSAAVTLASRRYPGSAVAWRRRFVSGRRPPSIIAPARHTLERPGPRRRRRTSATCVARITSWKVLGDAGLDSVRILIPGSAAIYAPSSEPIREDHPLAPDEPLRIEQARARAAGAACVRGS